MAQRAIALPRQRKRTTWALCVGREPERDARELLRSTVHRRWVLGADYRLFIDQVRDGHHNPAALFAEARHRHVADRDQVSYARRCRTHPECREAGRKAKASQRAERRLRLIRIQRALEDGTVEVRWVHPALAPADDTTRPARHGTVYARREFGCDCPPAGERAAALPPLTPKGPTDEHSHQF